MELDRANSDTGWGRCTHHQGGTGSRKSPWPARRTRITQGDRLCPRSPSSSRRSLAGVALSSAASPLQRDATAQRVVARFGGSGDTRASSPGPLAQLRLRPQRARPRPQRGRCSLLHETTGGDTGPPRLSRCVLRVVPLCLWGRTVLTRTSGHARIRASRTITFFGANNKVLHTLLCLRGQNRINSHGHNQA